MNQDQVRKLVIKAIQSVYVAYFSQDNPGIQQTLMLLEANLSSVLTQLNKDDLQSRDAEFTAAAEAMKKNILPRIKQLDLDVEKFVKIEDDIKQAMSDLLKLSSSVSFFQIPSI